MKDYIIKKLNKKELGRVQSKWNNILQAGLNDNSLNYLEKGMLAEVCKSELSDYGMKYCVANKNYNTLTNAAYDSAIDLYRRLIKHKLTFKTLVIKIDQNGLDQNFKRDLHKVLGIVSTNIYNKLEEKGYFEMYNAYPHKGKWFVNYVLKEHEM